MTTIQSIAASPAAQLHLFSPVLRTTAASRGVSLCFPKPHSLGSNSSSSICGSRRISISSCRPMFGRLLGKPAMASAAVADKTFYDFTVKNIDGAEVALSEYKGKVALIVNVASACGLTQSNYKELTEIYDKYKDQGFVVLAFPSNQFGGQEPGSNEQIKEFACSRFKAQFPMFDKIDVNGPNTAPVYQWLKSQKGELLGSDIKWNFGKFLVDKSGTVVNRYAPTTSPSAIEKDIKKLL
eukprot:TRINITY_DN3573_c0_g1_i1.p1 TRINITY_DN3573_c0_g1~~TRINITY_DN3573_c0_g1_i1.p1  ORF type:complete len:239 (+),score=66.69 TRINITY_DN3573_c0_g1_i1:91-807(+)